MATVTVKDIITSKNPCGFCATGAHDHCPGGVLNGNQTTLVVCSCAEHAVNLRCLDCGHRGGTDDISFETWTCIDGDACDARIAARREAAHRALYGVDSTGKPRTFEQFEKKAKEASPRAPKSAECRCSCGGTTKGGAYLPGHDARHISEVYKTAMATGQPIDEALAIFADKPALQAKLAKRFGK